MDATTIAVFTSNS